MVNKLLEELYNLSEAKGVKLYLVGGYIRDLLLGALAEPINLDFAIRKGAIDFAKYVSKNIGGKFVLLDERFGSGRVALTYNLQKIEMDFTDFKGRTIKEDLLCRDFTINSMAIELEIITDYTDYKSRLHRLKQDIIDPAGGLKDLRKKLIRTVYKDAFKEDPLRILRGFSIASRFKGFKITDETEALMKRFSHLLYRVSGERILDELCKILSKAKSFKYLKKLDELGILVNVFPQIKYMKDVDQGGYHHLDVWRHSLESVRQLEMFLARQKFTKNLKSAINNYLDECITNLRKRLWLIKLALLFHDVGKPKAKYIDKDGLIWFTGHEKISCSIAKEVSSRIRLSKKERDSLNALILYHLRPGYLAREIAPTRRAIFRFFKDTKEDAPGVLLLWISDRLATRGGESEETQVPCHKKFVIRLLAEYFLKPESIARPVNLLNGNEVMDILKIAPGPLVGQILQKTQEAAAEKLISTKDEAKDFIIKIYKEMI